jgi:alpha-glucosidase
VVNKAISRLALAWLAGAAWPVGSAWADELAVARGGMTVHVTAISDHVMRVRMAPVGESEGEGSWAVPASIRKGGAAATRKDTTLATAALRAVYDPASKLLHFEDAAGHVVFAESAVPVRDGAGFSLRSALGADDHIYALGDKAGPLDRHGQSFVNWNTDAYGFAATTDPIYKTIPFFISTGGAGGAYGVLLDNTWRTWFDFGHRMADRLEIGAEGGPIDYYVIAGPSLRDVTRRYADLTGHAPLPPRWALGYQQSRYSYMSEAEVRDVAQHLRAVHIPTDVIWLDIDYQDRNRPFTVDHTAFAHFAAMVHDLDAMGIKTVPIVDLHVAAAPGQGYAPYDSGSAGDHFVHRADGSVFVGPVWPGPAVFPEFTDAATRRWWGTLFAPLLHDGVAGFWNDMNEPAVFGPSKTMPADVRHRIASDDFVPRTASHAEIHNVYGMENTRATYEGLRALAPDERAFVMTRASYAGGQRYAATWTGDNSATWDHLKLAVAQTLNLGLSGFAWTGADVGGFTGGPSPDLLTRWFEYAAFLPLFRDHSAKGVPRAEPWVDGPEHLAIRRHYVETRYRLMPYLYALAEANARTGDPLARPLAYDYRGTDGADCNTAMSFTLGGRLLISGAPRPEQHNSYAACLPQGGWYDYWSGLAVDPVPSADGAYGTLTLTPRIDTLPVFVRAGTILPQAPLVQSTSERPQGPLELHVYPGPDCAGDIYDDDGHSLGFAKGAFARQHVACEVGAQGVTRVTLAPRQGSHAPWWGALALTIHGGGHYVARMGGKALAGQDNRFVLADQPAGATIELERQ